MILLLALAACTRIEGAPSEVEPAHDDEAGPEAPPDDTTDDTTEGAAAFAPATFTLEGAFAYDPDLGRLVPWTERYVVAQDTGLTFTFFDAAGAPLCVARLAFDRGGADAPALAVWRFEDIVDTDWGPLEAHLSHYAFVATPDSADHDCPALDAAVWGTDDIGALLLAHEWGVGFGTASIDLPADVDPHAFGGSIAGRPVADGTPAIDAVAWATASKLDEDHAVEHDIRDQSPILLDPEAVLDAGEPPRAVYRVTASVAWEADRLRP